MTVAGQPRNPAAYAFEDGLVVVRPGIERFFLLNPTARFIWDSLHAAIPLDEIARDISEACGIAVPVALRDVAEAVRQWTDVGLMTMFADLPDSGRSLCQPQRPGYPPITSDRYDIAGSRVRIDLWDLTLATDLIARFSGFHRADQDAVDTVFEAWVVEGDGVIHRDGQCVAREPASSMRGALIQEIAKLWNPEAEWLASLHAGAVTRDSSCILLPATTGGGKSTLVAALTHRGFDLMTEDMALLNDRTLSVSVLPHAIKLREGSWEILRPFCAEIDTAPDYTQKDGQKLRFLSPNRISPAREVPAKCLLFIRFDAGANVKVRDVSAFDALARLADAGLWVDLSQEKVSKFLAWILETPKRELIYSDLNDAVEAVGALL
jgi:hypothetical protein